MAGVIFSTDKAAAWRKILSNLFSFPSSTLAGQPALGLQQCIPTRRAAVPGLLRARLDEMTHKRGGRVSFPRPAFCTDNGAMIAFAGALRLQAGQHENETVTVFPRWDMAGLSAV